LAHSPDGGHEAVGLATELANSIGRSNALHKTYTPVEIEAVRNTDEARQQGRRCITGTKTGHQLNSPEVYQPPVSDALSP
jgi:hypothetical protein